MNLVVKEMRRVGIRLRSEQEKLLAEYPSGEARRRLVRALGQMATAPAGGLSSVARITGVEVDRPHRRPKSDKFFCWSGGPPDPNTTVTWPADPLNDPDDR